MAETTSLELLVAVPGSESPEDRVSDSFVAFLREAAEEVGCEYKVNADAEYGRGASQWAVILTFSAAAFLAGKRIEENLDAWLRLAKRLANLIAKLRARSGPVFVGPSGAQAVLLSFLADRTEIKELATVCCEEVYVDRRMDGSFQHSPERFYLGAFVVNRSKLHLLVMKSTAELKLHESFAVGSAWKFMLDR